MTSPVGVPILPKPIICDLYEDDLDGKPKIEDLINAGPPWYGLGLKATEGLWAGNNPGWFQYYWKRMAELAGDKLGVDFFRACYHYYLVWKDPIAQSAFYCKTVDRAGGRYQSADFWPVVDVESADNPSTSSAQQWIDGVSKFAECVKRSTGRDVVLYGASLMYDKGITDHMGCQYIWPARYTADTAYGIPDIVINRIGWKREEMLCFQYAGTGPHDTIEGGYYLGQPRTSPMGNCDLSTVEMFDGLALMRRGGVP